MVWIAKENIGDYKKGDVVPDAQAVAWDAQFEFSPVEQKEVPVEQQPEPVKETVVEKPVVKKKVSRRTRKK